MVKCAKPYSHSHTDFVILGRRQTSRTGASNEDGKENSTETIPPPVGDAQLWPTPELALSEDRKKSTSQDRVEKSEGKDKSETKSSSSKPAPKIWVQLPYVPSAKFMTPLPPAAARRGAKPAIQGGRREDTERGARAVNNGIESDKPGPTNTMGPPPRPRPGDDQDRGRDQEVAGSDRATSAPSQPRRAASASAVPAEQRKRLTLSSKDRNGNEYKTDASGNPPYSNEGSEDKSTRQSFGPRSESKSSRPFQPSDQSSRRGSIETSRQSSIPGDAHSHPKYDASNRRSMPADFYGSPDNLGHTQYPYFPREQESTRYRHTTRDKSDFSRENISTWRDRDARPEREGRSDSRPERGRGSYRGRGSHQTYDPTVPSPHAYTAPLPQQPFSSSKSHSFHSGLRQTSQPYPTLSLQTGQYPTVRSHSIPNSGMYPAIASPIQAMHQSLSPIQAEMPMYGFQPAMHPAFIGPVPYNPALQTMGILQMVKNQVLVQFFHPAVQN
jgi:la-related protein 1